VHANPSRLLRFFALASLASLGACSSSASSPVVSDKHLDVSRFQKVCVEGIGDLKPAFPVDYLAIVASGGGGPTLEPSPELIDASLDAGSSDAAAPDAARPPGPSYGSRLAFAGVPCATATNREECEAKLSAASAPRGMTAWSSNAGYSGGARPPEPSYAHYVYTRGDEVRAITTREDLVPFLAPIESVAEAVHTGGGPYSSSCVSVRNDPEGLAFFGVSCDTSSDYPFETITLVLRDGSQRQLERSQPTDGSASYCAPKP